MAEPRGEDEFEFGIGGGLDDEFEEETVGGQNAPPHSDTFADTQSSPGGGHAGHHDSTDHQCLELCPICRGADMLRAAVPPELHGQLQLVQRDALLLARSLIEAHLARLQEEPAHRPQRAQHPSEDIPLD